MSDFTAWTRTGWSTAGDGPGTTLSDAGVTLELLRDGSVAESIPVRGRVAGPGDVVALGAGAVRRIVPGDNSTDLPSTRLAFVEFHTADLPWCISPPPTVGAPQPWLALIVLREDEATLTPSPGPEVVSCSDTVLPAISGLHAFAHVQGGRARLIAPRRLKEGERYVALLVPTFEEGRRAGLRAAGRDGASWSPVALDTPAWAASGDTVELPVYLRWTFSTVRPLRLSEKVDQLSRGQVAELGWRRISAAAPGLGVTDGGVHFTPGALVPPASEPAYPLDDTARAALRVSIDAVLDRDDEDPDHPVLGPPVRGKRLFDADTDVSWCGDLNLEPRWRVVAGAAEAVVRALQDDLVRDIQDGIPTDLVRRDADRTQVGAVTLETVVGTDASVHPSYGFLLARTSDTHAASGQLGRVVADPALRRALRPGAALVRQMARAVGHTVGTAAHAFAAADGGQVRRGDPVLRTLADEIGTLATSLTPIPGGDQIEGPRPPRPPVQTATTAAPASVDDASRAATLALADAIDRLHARRDTANADRDTTATGLDIALVDALARWDIDWLLPGVRNLPAETVVILESNDAFVASFLIAANEEILRELTWREVPHEPRTALVPCFWKPGVVDLDTAKDWTEGTLGSHVAMDETWVLVRSALWQACPDLALVAFPASGADDTLAPKAGGTWVLPTQELQLADDLVLVALPLTHAELVGGDGESGHYLVFTEPDEGTAFKVDEDRDPDAGVLVGLKGDGAAEAKERVDSPDAAWVWAGRYV